MRTDAITFPAMPIVPSLMGRAWLTRFILGALGVLLLTVSAKAQIPLWPVPMTMQTYVVLVLGMAYGTRLGVATVLSYLALGALGLPVFAGTPQQGAGLPYMLGPTGGYLVGFVVAAALVGTLAERGWDRRWSTSLVAMTIAHLVIFACGVSWLATMVGVSKAVQVGFMPFLLATVIKTLLAAASLPVAWKLVRKS